MTTIVWDGKTLAADCLSTNRMMQNVEHRRGYVNKIYLFPSILWGVNKEDETENEVLLAAAFSGMQIIIDKIVFLLRRHDTTKEISDYLDSVNNLQLSSPNFSQLYITNKAAYVMNKPLGSTKIVSFQHVVHTAYKEPSKKDIRRQFDRPLLVLGVGVQTLKDLWVLTQHELTSEELVFLANGFSLNVGNGIDTWRIGDTSIQHRAEFSQDEKAAIAEKLSKHIMNITAQNFPTDEENVIVNI